MNALAHLFELDRRIRAGEFPNAPTLASDLGISERVVFRDRRKLVEMGADIGWNKKRSGWYYRDLSFVLPTARLSEGELLAFFLSVEIARSSGNAGFEETLQSAVAKIALSVGEVVSVDLNALRDSTTYSFSPAARADALLMLALQRAAASRQKVQMRYYTASRGQWSERVVHPYHLHFARGEWILIAFDENQSAPRCFNIARISGLETLAKHFERRADFEAKEFVRTMFFAEAGEQTFQVEVRFDEYQTRYIRERVWHPEQELEPLPDGGALLRFPASGLHEIARWVLGYGRHAQVLEPPQLVTLVQSHIIELSQMYAEPADSTT